MAMITYYPVAGNPYLNERWIAVLAVASDIAPKLATEIDAGTSLDISCAISDWFPTSSQGTQMGRRRACDAAALQKLTPEENQLPELEYIWRPSLATADTNNKAYATLTPGLTLWLVHRTDVAQATAFAVGQFVDVYQVRLGSQRTSRTNENNDQGTEYTIKQALESLKVTKHVAIVT